MCSRGSYVPERKTWSKRGDLRMGNYDPFPELLPPNERNIHEGYTVGDPSDCGTAYNWGLRRVNEIPLQQRTLLLQEGYARKMREGYTVGDPSDCGTAYNWGLRRVNEIPLQQRTLLMQEGYKQRENYGSCCPQPFAPVNKTWAPQKPFSL